MAEMGVPTTASATTITTATTTTTALLLLRLLLETRRFPAFAFKVTNPQPLSSLSPSSPLPLPQPSLHFPPSAALSYCDFVTFALILTHITVIASFFLHSCARLVQTLNVNPPQPQEPPSFCLHLSHPPVPTSPAPPKLSTTPLILSSSVPTFSSHRVKLLFFISTCIFFNSTSHLTFHHHALHSPCCFF